VFFSKFCEIVILVSFLKLLWIGIKDYRSTSLLLKTEFSVFNNSRH